MIRYTMTVNNVVGIAADYFLQAVMVGDDIVSDIGGAQVCGIAGVLVRTGKYRYVLTYTGKSARTVIY